MKSPSQLILRRPDISRFDKEAAAVTALFLAARRAALPGLREVHTDDETLTWMRDVVFPRQSVRLADGQAQSPVIEPGASARDEPG